MGDLSNDLSLMEGNIGFLSGENEQNIVFDVLPDNLPELNEVSIFMYFVL